MKEATTEFISFVVYVMAFRQKGQPHNCHSKHFYASTDSMDLFGDKIQLFRIDIATLPGLTCMYALSTALSAKIISYIVVSHFESEMTVSLHCF